MLPVLMKPQSSVVKVSISSLILRKAISLLSVVLKISIPMIFFKNSTRLWKYQRTMKPLVMTLILKLAGNWITKICIPLSLILNLSHQAWRKSPKWERAKKSPFSGQSIYFRFPLHRPKSLKWNTRRWLMSICVSLPRWSRKSKGMTFLVQRTNKWFKNDNLWFVWIIDNQAVKFNYFKSVRIFIY
jgi:hypothetical protein